MFVTSTLVSCHFVTLISIKSASVLSTSVTTSGKKTGRKVVRAISAESIYHCMLLFLDHILYRSGWFPHRVVSALSHFGPGLFRPGSFRPILVGLFGLIFLSTPRLRIIGRKFIWLFDEESSDVKGLFFKVPPG